MKQTMEQLDKTKSDFISVASHELRTPLTLIEGYAAILRENLGHVNNHSSSLSEDNGNILLLDGIHNGARRLRGIVDDMVDVSMIDNNLLNLNFQPVWINRLFFALRNELRENLQERKQSLEILDFPGSNDMTFGDPERLLQVFRNLLTNAIKYTPDNKLIQVDGRKLPGFIEVLVRDNGIGIASEDITRIFEKFFRVSDPMLHSSGKTKYKGGGPGLGLHIAKGIIEAHGGAIWADSSGFDEECCPGSTFHVLLPLRDQPPDIQMENWYSSPHPKLHRKEIP
jgi:signal transduction histidine kinase